MAVAKVVTTLLMERFKLCKTDERPRISFSFSRISKQKKEAIILTLQRTAKNSLSRLSSGIRDHCSTH